MCVGVEDRGEDDLCGDCSLQIHLNEVTAVNDSKLSASREE